MGGFGRLDVLVADAGISTIGPVADGDIAGWSAMVDVDVKGVLHAIAAALPVFRAQGSGHLVAVVSTSGLKIVPGQAVCAGTRNAVRTKLADSIDDPAAREKVRQGMADLGLEPAAVARATAFAVDQDDDVEIGDLTIRPTRPGLSAARQPWRGARQVVRVGSSPDQRTP